MSNTLDSPYTNSFTRDFVIDPEYEKIIKEVSTRKPGSKAGKKLTLTLQKLSEYLYWISEGETVENAAVLAKMTVALKDKLHANSPTFVRLQELAENDIVRVAKKNLRKFVEGQLPMYYKLVNPKTNEVKFVELKEIQPNLNAITYILDKKKAFGDIGEPGTPKLGAPRNKEEAELLKWLLQEHYSYVREQERKT